VGQQLSLFDGQPIRELPLKHYVVEGKTRFEARGLYDAFSKLAAHFTSLAVGRATTLAADDYLTIKEEA